MVYTRKTAEQWVGTGRMWTLARVLQLSIKTAGKGLGIYGPTKKQNTRAKKKSVLSSRKRLPLISKTPESISIAPKTAEATQWGLPAPLFLGLSPSWLFIQLRMHLRPLHQLPQRKEERTPSPFPTESCQHSHPNLDTNSSSPAQASQICTDRLWPMKASLNRVCLW